MIDIARPAPQSPNGLSHLLLVEDDEGLLELFRQQLENCGLTLHSKTSARAALEWLGAQPDCLMLLDYSLPDMTAKGLIAAAAQQGSVPPFIVITGHGDERIAVEMMKLGARDYVVKDATLLDRLPAVVERALREIENQRRLAASERKFQAIFEGSDDALLLLDQRGFLDCNGCALSLFGLEHKSHLRELHIADLSPGVQPDGRDSRAAANEWVASALQGLTRRFEWVCRRQDGREFPTEVLLSPFELDGHTVLLATVRDITERRRIEEVQAFLAQTSSGPTPEPFFNKLARYLAQSLEMDYVCIDRLEAGGLTARTVAVWCDGGFKENVTYALKDTPCGEVVGKTVCCYPASVSHFFPRDQVLQNLQAESCVGVTLSSHAGPPIGLIAVIGRKPLMNRAIAVATLNLVAARAAGELERQQAEQCLRESEQRFREIVEDTQAGYFRLDQQGCYVAVNRAWLSMHGYSTPEEIVGRPFSLTQTGESLPAAQSVMERLLAGEPVPVAELARRCKDGSVGTHTFSAHPVRQGSVITGLEGFLIDTTSLKRAEADYAMLFEKMLDGFALHEMIFTAAGHPCDYRFLAVNPGFEHMTGLPAKSVLGKTIREVTPGIEPFWIETYGRVVATGEPELFEHFSSELNRHFEVSAFRPAPGRFACVIVDITERKQAEAEALRYQAQLEAIYDNAPLMMCLVNERREVERMNRAMATLSGRAQPDADARRHGDVLGCLNALDDPAGCGAGPHCLNCTLRTAVADTFQTGLPQSGVETSHFLASPGGRREVRLSASTALVRIAAETKLLLCLEDVTVRKQLEQQFLQAQKMEAVGQLAGGVAHDFNNILAAIIMHLHLLQEGAGLDATMAGALKEVQSYAQRAAELTRQLLLFSRRKTAQTKRLDVNELLEGMLKMLRRVLGEHIEMKLETAPDGQWVDADPGMLEQIVMNLCVNARDAMPRGGRLTLATATVEFPEGHSHSHPDGRVGRFVCLSVHDSGDGMDESTLKRIFEPFFTTKAVGKGTGLGLATVYGIVRQHQGWVQVESAVGLGTTFRVYLPRTAAPETSFTDKDITVIPRGSETILVVEDEPGLLKLAATVLRRCGYRVLEARSGVEALSVWQETGGEADLLFTDVVMPGGVGGLELMERLHATKPGLKVILSSGYSLELARRKVGQHEQARLLAKPYDPVMLAKTVREVLDKH